MLLRCLLTNTFSKLNKLTDGPYRFLSSKFAKWIAVFEELNFRSKLFKWSLARVLNKTLKTAF